MRNITGTPVEDEDFFERPEILENLLRELRDGANLRMNAPRRVGKTSLVLRACRAWEERGKTAVFLNVEDTADELSFAEKLLKELQNKGLQPDNITKCQLLIGRVRKSLGISKTKVSMGMDLELGDGTEAQSATLGRAIESVFEGIESNEEQVLIAIDEMPEILLALMRSEGGHQRVSRILHWLRALRQTYRKQIRWLFLGSIGLEGFVEEHLLGKTINDLTPFTLGALPENEADSFLEKLGQDNLLLIPPEIRQRMIQLVGWPLPHHLQVLFHALRDLGINEVDQASVDAAHKNLLSPANLSQFDTWRQRLDEQFSKEDAQAARAILNHVCQHSSGRRRDQILDELVRKRPEADLDSVEEQVARLLQLLQRDGYLMESDGNYAFRSFLLRDYWHRRNIV